MNMPKARITKVGRFESDLGSAIPRGWNFNGEGRAELLGFVLDEDMTVRSICGWSIPELHRIAHGVPCFETHCAVDQRVVLS